MELRYLQIYRAISNFATSLVGLFIPLIVYQNTHNIIYAVAYMVLYRLASYVFNKLLKSFTLKKPQLMLVLRIIPIVIYEVCTIFVDYNPILFCIIMGLGYALDYSFSKLPSEMIFNYNTTDSSAKSLGIIRTIEQVGYVLATIMGAIFLDNLPIYYLIVLSIALYIISLIPLIIFYIKNKNNKFYNTEWVSNAFQEDKSNKSKHTRIANRVKNKYCLLSITGQGIDTFYYLALPLLTYLSYGKYVNAALLVAVFDIALCIFGYFIGVLDEKHDLTIATSVCTVLCGALIVLFSLLIGNTNLFILEAVIVVFISLTSTFPYVFCYNKMLVKTRLLGNASAGIMGWYNSGIVADAVYQSVGFFGTLLATGIVSGVSCIVCGIAIPFVEESTRKDMVGYIQQNEITNDIKHDIKKLHKSKATAKSSLPVQNNETTNENNTPTKQNEWKNSIHSKF